MSIKRGATYEDLAGVPDDQIAEIVEGELYASPWPRIRHARVLSALGAKLFSAFDEGVKPPFGWWLLDEPELHLGDDVLVPDIAGWRRENLPALPDTPSIDLAPDWVCEILSPSTFVLDRQHKLPAYARHRVSWLWLIDPSEKTLEVFRSRSGGWSGVEFYRGDASAHAEPFEGAGIELTAIFAS